MQVEKESEGKGRMKERNSLEGEPQQRTAYKKKTEREGELDMIDLDNHRKWVKWVNSSGPQCAVPCHRYTFTECSWSDS